MANKKKRDQDWVEAKRRCQLNQEDIRKAKELGLNPRKLIKNIPSKSQQWKAPVKYWIRELYEKQQRKIAARRASKLDKPLPEMSESASRLSSEAVPNDADFLFDDDSIPAVLDILPTTIQCRLMSTSCSMSNQSWLMLTSWSTTIQSPSE